MKVNLLLSRPKGPLIAKVGQLFIRIAGRSSMSHCAIQLDNLVYECTRKGVQSPIYFDDWISLQSSFSQAFVIELTDSSKISLILSKINELSGSSYDMNANLSQIVNKDIQDPSKLNCLEYVNEVLSSIELHPFHRNKSSGRSPGDLESLSQYEWR